MHISKLLYSIEAFDGKAKKKKFYIQLQKFISNVTDSKTFFTLARRINMINARKPVQVGLAEIATYFKSLHYESKCTMKLENALTLPNIANLMLE